MSMAFYAVAVLPLIRAVKNTEGLSRVLQMWYADDSSGGASIPELIEWFRALIAIGPSFG